MTKYTTAYVLLTAAASALATVPFGCSSSNETTIPLPGAGGTTAPTVTDSGGVRATNAGGTAGKPTGDPVTGSWSDLTPSTAPTHATPVAENTGTVTKGGTMTFQHIGAPGYWGRRIEANPGDPRCSVQSETIDFGWGSEFCCRERHEVTSDRLTPFNDPVAIVLDGPLRVKQLAVYQPLASNQGAWAIRSFWDRSFASEPFNIHFSGPNDARAFSGDLGNNCSFFAMQTRPFPCGPGSDPYCPGSALDYEGWVGSKLFVMLAAMPYADDPSVAAASCISTGQDERAEDSPWVGIALSELDRDGWSGYNPCHCFANTNPGVGDGCGQINVFEVVAESSGERWGNRDVISTGIRSYQVGSLGGVTCGIAGCGIAQFPPDADLLDANHLTAMTSGAIFDADHPAQAAGPVWRRSRDDRYYLFLLDEDTRTVQVAVVHPANLPAALATWLPQMPNLIGRRDIDALLELRLPQ